MLKGLELDMHAGAHPDGNRLLQQRVEHGVEHRVHPFI